MGRGNFEAGKGRPIVKVKGHSAVICAKMAKPVEMPFGLWVRMGPKNNVLDELQIPDGKGYFGKRAPVV